MSASLGLDIALVAAGLILAVLVWVMIGLLPRARGMDIPPADPPTAPGAGTADEAVFIVQAGGRVEYLSEGARQWFGLNETEPVDLERLMRRVRPADDFLRLCAGPARGRLTINGRLLEAASYQIPGEYSRVLVSLRAIESVPGLEPGSEAAGSILKIVTDFSQAIASTLDLPGTLGSVLEKVGQLVPADVMELKVLDVASKTLVPYRFRGTGTGSHVLVRAPDSQFGPLTEQLMLARKSLMLNGPEVTVQGPSGRFQSYLGIKLLSGGELMGTLEAGQMGSAAFGQHDVDLLSLVAGQAAVAIRNAVLYEQEQRRAAELAGLANLAQAVSAVQDPRDLFSRLVESVAPLFDLEILGFLLFDENRRTLEGQIPFHGLPVHIVELYRVPIEPNSPAEHLMLEAKPLITEDASSDEGWRTLGLRDIAVAASLRDSALIPLVSHGSMVGYLHASHHRGGPAPFSAQELRLLNIVGNQAANIIGNALLVRESRARAQRSDALRHIASLSASSATVDEVLKYSVQELAHIFQADVAGIFLIDAERGELALHQPSVWGVSEGLAESFGRVPVGEPAYLSTVSHSLDPFLSGRLSADRRSLPMYRPLAGELNLESALVVPLVAREHSLGELMLGSAKTEHFSAYDQQVLTTAAGQLASAIQASRLLGQTDESLRRRVQQLTAIARVGWELGASLDARHVLEIIHTEALRLTGADCGSILLLEAGEDQGPPSVRLSVGCPADAGLSALDRQAFESGSPLRVNDFVEEGGTPPHEGVRSAVVVPVIRQDRVIGIINLHSARPLFFDESAQKALEVLAGQAAVAVYNSSQFQEERQRSELLRRRAETLSSLSSVSHALRDPQPVEQALHTIAQGIHDSTPFRVVLVSIYEPATGLLRRVTAVGIPPETLNELLVRKQPLASLQQLLRPEFKIGRAYFIPADQTPVLPADVHYVYAQYEAQGQAAPANAWDPDDFLLLPLEDAQGNPLGLISLDDPSNGLRPDRAAIDTLDLFAAQAALEITKAARLAELESRIDSLTDGLQRQQKLLSFSQNDLPLLLHKDLEQTMALHGLERRAQRVYAGLAITESVSRQLDANSALLALARETLSHLGMAAAIIAEDSPDGPRLLHVLGSIPRATNVEALFGQRNPLRLVLQTGQPVLVSNLDESEEWRDSPLLSSLRAKGMICLPLTAEERTVAAMLAVSPEPFAAFTEEDRQVYYQISRQTSVVLQNISLLNETRRRLQEVNLLLDFSRRLTGLTPDDMVSNLLESARRVLQAAHAGVVFLWNAHAGQLIPKSVSGYVDNASLMRIHYGSGEALPGQVFQSGAARRVSELNFARDYALSADNLVLYRRATGGRLPVSSLLVPIHTGDRGIGLVVLDNFNTVSAFKAEDEALILSLAQQVALSLENVRLVQAAQERAGRLQALNDSAASMTASLRSEELVRLLLTQLGTILPYDTATLWLRDGERLRVAAAVGFPDTDRRLGLTIAASDSALFNEMAGSGRAMAVGDVREDPRFPHVEVPRLSWLGVPLISKGRLAGVIALEKWQAYFYDSDYIQLATTFASQAIISLENAGLYEDSVQRAAELDERSGRLALLNRFSAALSGLLDADQILALTAEEIAQVLGAGRVSGVMFERGRAVWRVSTPASSAPLPQTLPDAPIFDRLRDSRGIFHTTDIHKEPDLAPLSDLLAGTASLLIVPLIGGTELRALLFAHLSGEARFGPNEVDLARTIANQGATALENARLYQDTVRTADRFAILNEGGARISTSLEAEQIYAAVHQAAERVMPIDSFVISLLDEATREIETVYAVDRGKRLPASRSRKSGTLSGRVIESGQPAIINDLGSPTGRAVDRPIAGLGGSASIIAVPMTIGGRALGVLSAQSYQPGAFSSEDVQILGTLANQAIVSIQNGRLFAETQRLAQELEQRVIDRTAELQREQQNTEMLLRILTEVSSSLDLDRALNRTLALLNDATGAEQGTIMLLQPEDSLLHYRAGYGYLSDRLDPTTSRGFTLKVGEGLAGWVVQNREPVLVDDLRQDPRWVRSPSSSQEHRSAIVAPLLVGEDVIGVLMIFHRATRFFSPDILQMVRAIAGQVAVAINNAHLYELIRDQAERLGVMLRKEQEDASRSQAILEAVADGVLVTAVDNTVAFANASIERVLDVQVSRIMDRPLESIGGVFGRSAAAWMETIRRWSEEPSSYGPGDTYAEQLELGNGRVALIHLAPVIFQNDFLGTVSIFRDITHEVEVDRLKSEFVATVSHELRTPMTSIKGYVDILLMGAAGAFNEKQTHFLEVVQSNAERLNVLVNDLLDISRIEAGQVSIEPEPLDLRLLAEDVIREVQHRSEEDCKPMAVSLEAPPSLPRVLGDSARIRQIMANLMDNAYNYTPENGTIRIQINPVDGREIQVDIEDNGVGISLQDQPRVFERFYRGEHPMVLATPGTGLGLSIVRELVEMHHGRIWMNSRGIPGEGSTFSFTLPAQWTD